MSTSPPDSGESRTSLCADLDARHRRGVSLVWAARAPLHVHPSFSPPLGRLQNGLVFEGRPREGFGVWWSRGEPEEVWRKRAAQARVCFPRYSRAEMDELSEEGVDAAYNEPVVELRPSDSDARVVVARLPARETLRATVDAALARYVPDDGHPLSGFAGDEGLLLPVVNVEYGEIHARFDEGGEAPPSSPASFGLLSSPRRFVCVPPFLILVLPGGSRAPELVVWVEGTDLLVSR